MTSREYDYVFVEEVRQLTQDIFDRVVSFWDAAATEPVLVFVGTFHKLRGIPQDGSYPARALDSPRWQDVARKST